MRGLGCGHFLVGELVIWNKDLGNMTYLMHANFTCEEFE